MLSVLKKEYVPTLQNEGNIYNYDPYPIINIENPTGIPEIDLLALKALILADQNAIGLLTGSNGVDGNKILISTSDPNNTTVANVGDLFLNSTNGTLYQKSSMTQTDFFNSGLQGLVLPNALWLNKGNLKGINGTTVKFVNNETEFVNPKIGDICIINSTFQVFEYTELPGPNGSSEPIPLWSSKGFMRNQDSAIRVLQNQTEMLVPSDFGKIILILQNSDVEIIVTNQLTLDQSFIVINAKSEQVAIQRAGVSTSTNTFIDGNSMYVCTPKAGSVIEVQKIGDSIGITPPPPQNPQSNTVTNSFHVLTGNDSERKTAGKVVVIPYSDPLSSYTITNLAENDEMIISNYSENEVSITTATTNNVLTNTFGVRSRCTVRVLVQLSEIIIQEILDGTLYPNTNLHVVSATNFILDDDYETKEVFVSGNMANFDILIPDIPVKIKTINITNGKNLTCYVSKEISGSSVANIPPYSITKIVFDGNSWKTAQIAGTSGGSNA